MSKKTFVTDDYILSSEWDWDKNSKLGISPAQTTNHSGKKVWWICSNGHSYDATVANRTNGKGCPICAGRKVLIGYNDLETWCIENQRTDLIEEFDTAKNGFTMQAITKGCGKGIWWICTNGHSYNASLHHRINMNTGCGICSHKILLSGYNDLQTTHPDIAKEFDVERNGTTPDRVMAGSVKAKYWFVCPKGHNYSTTLLNRMHGRNCPICSRDRHISFPEKALLFYLSRYFTTVSENYRAEFLGNKELDIYIHCKRYAIEYDGRAWHRSVKRDIDKDNICSQNGVTLIRVRETGCPEYESTSIKYYVAPDSDRELEEAICSVINTIDPTLSKSIDICIERDRTHIYELMELSEKNNSIISRRPEIRAFWDHELNGILLPEQVSFSSTKRIHFACAQGHKWTSSVRSFYATPHCPICSGKRIVRGFNDLGTTNPELKAFWSERNRLNIGKYSPGSNVIVFWKCDKCNGEYSMRIAEKVRKKTGCPYCNNRQLLSGFNDLESCDAKLAEEFDVGKNGLLPSQVICGGHKVYWWKCTYGHSYQAQMMNRRRGTGCPICAGKRVIIGDNDLQSCFPEIAKEFDTQNNGGKTAQSFTAYSNSKVWWKCSKCNSVWLTSIEKRTKRGQGCPVCAKAKGNHTV